MPMVPPPPESYSLHDVIPTSHEHIYMCKSHIDIVVAQANSRLCEPFQATGYNPKLAIPTMKTRFDLLAQH